METRSARQHLRRYQLQWQPAFPATISGNVRMYVLGEHTKLVGDGYENLDPYRVDPTLFNKEEIIRVGHNSTLILPFNTGVAKAQEYSPKLSNKVIEQLSLGGNTVTTFGEAPKKIGLNVKIIKLGEAWQGYVGGLEAMHYLSSNQGRVYGSLYLLGFDMFKDGTQLYRGRYKVVMTKLDFHYRSDRNTTVDADVQMIVTRDFSTMSGRHKQPWGAL